MRKKTPDKVNLTSNNGLKTNPILGFLLKLNCLIDSDSDMVHF